MQKEMKERIEKLVDVYCAFVFSIDRDAGWHSPSQLEALKDACSKSYPAFQQKQLSVRVSAGTERQANDCADEKMINEIRFVRNKHHDFELARMLFSKLEEKQLLALLANLYLIKVYKKTFTAVEIANYLEQTADSYRYNRKVALAAIAKNLLLIDEYMSLKKHR